MAFTASDIATKIQKRPVCKTRLEANLALIEIVLMAFTVACYHHLIRPLQSQLQMHLMQQLLLLF